MAIEMSREARQQLHEDAFQCGRRREPRARKR